MLTVLQRLAKRRVRPRQPSEPALNELQFSALLISKVCHDLLSPVGAVLNGLQVLEGENSPILQDPAMALIATTAQQASAKLEFCRLAYGAMGSAGGEIGLSDARDALAKLLKDGRVKLKWDAPQVAFPKDVVKLALNMAIAVMDAIPRGGELRVSVTRNGDTARVDVEAEGVNALLKPPLIEALAGRHEGDVCDLKSVQHFLTGLIARNLGTRVEASSAEGVVRIAATLPELARAAA